MHGNVTVASHTTDMTNTKDQILNHVLVDKILEAVLVRILKFELVVVCQKAEEKKGFKSK